MKYSPHRIHPPFHVNESANSASQLSQYVCSLSSTRCGAVACPKSIWPTLNQYCAEGLWIIVGRTWRKLRSQRTRTDQPHWARTVRRARKLKCRLPVLLFSSPNIVIIKGGVDSSFKMSSPSPAGSRRRRSPDDAEDALQKCSNCRRQLSLSFFAAEGGRQFRTCNLCPVRSAKEGTKSIIPS